MIHQVEPGLWWPDYDHAPEKCLAYVRKRLTDLDIAVGMTRDRRTCVQAGGHAGFWPMRLARSFGRVITFECEPALQECLRRNSREYNNIIISSEALGPELGAVHLLPSPSAGSWRVDANGTVPVRQITIDSLRLADCGAIFLDVEGYEVEALKGAAKTIEQFSPVIHVEELPRSREAIQAHLKSLGYRHRASVHNDRIYTR